MKVKNNDLIAVLDHSTIDAQLASRHAQLASRRAQLARAEADLLEAKADLHSLRKTIENDTRFMLAAIPEAKYFAEQSRSSIFLKVADTVIAVLLTIGAMFAAVRSRTREIGTLRSLGFSRGDVLISFMGESVLLCALGGIVGLLATLPLSALTYGTSNFNTFAEITIQFRFGPIVMLVAFLMTLAMGVFGGIFPALRAVRMNVVAALREV